MSNSYPVVTSPTTTRGDVASRSRGQPGRFRKAYLAWREVHRINRRYRRERRAFDRVLDNSYLDHNARQELNTLWTIRH